MRTNPLQKRGKAPVQLFLDPEDRQRLRVKALEDGQTMQDVLRKLVSGYLAGHYDKQLRKSHERA